MFLLSILFFCTVQSQEQTKSCITLFLAELQEIAHNKEKKYIYFETNECKTTVSFTHLMVWMQDLDAQHCYPHLSQLNQRIHNNYRTVPSDMLLNALSESQQLLHINKKKLSHEQFLLMTTAITDYLQFYARFEEQNP